MKTEDVVGTDAIQKIRAVMSATNATNHWDLFRALE
jgi:hypothetical protein